MKKCIFHKRPRLELMEARRLLTITGQAFSDFNSNGVRDGAEPALPGVTVFLDTNNNGVLNVGETSTSTDASGNYSFPGTTLGNYVVAQQTPAGFAQTAPLGGLVPGTNVNISRTSGNQAETTIALDPSNPQRLFTTSNATGSFLFGGYSTDGGTTWTTRNYATGSDGLPAACCDPSLAADTFGNLYLVYINSATNTIELARSTNFGQTFSIIKTWTGSIDQPTVVTGPGNVAGQQSVWVCFTNGTNIAASGAAVTGLGAVGTFTTLNNAPAPGGSAPSYADIAVGPSGQVIVGYQTDEAGQGPNSIIINLDADGLGAGGFGPAITATGTNVGGFDYIPPQSGRSVDAEIGFAWDRTGGAHNGRLYMVYTDEFPDESNNTDNYLRYSDNNGSTWSAPAKINDDATTRSQFMPRIAIDQTTGIVGLTWYDSRNDSGSGPGSTNAIANDDAQLWGTITSDGTTFAPNIQISAGTSNAAAAGSGVDYGDYVGLSFNAGVMYPIWSDNSNSTGNNPNGALHQFDYYTSKVVVIPSNQPGRYGVVAGPGQSPSGLNFANHDIAPPKVAASSFNFDAATQTVSVQFNENVSASLSTGDVTLTGVPNGSIQLSNYDTATNTASFTFPGFASGILPDGNYQFTVTAATVSDLSGNALDGNGDGTGGDNFAFSFFALAGDANRDHAVDTIDFNILASNFGQSPRVFSQGDFNYDGTVDTVDFDILASQFSKTLPAVSGASSRLKAHHRAKNSLAATVL